jgi:hypothetical protein
MYVAGNIVVDPNRAEQMRVEKYAPDGNLIWSINYDPSNRFDGASSLYLDGNVLYVYGRSGRDNSLISDVLFEKRNTADGALISRIVDAGTDSSLGLSIKGDLSSIFQLGVYSGLTTSTLIKKVK